LSFSDVDRNVVVRKLLNYILNLLSVFIRRWDIQLRKVAYTSYDLRWFVEQMDFTIVREDPDVSVFSIQGFIQNTRV
jgi:hypothetical protein